MDNQKSVNLDILQIHLHHHLMDHQFDKIQLINGEINPWYMVTSSHDNATNPRIDEHIRGDYIWSDDQFTILFDTYTDVLLGDS